MAGGGEAEDDSRAIAKEGATGMSKEALKEGIKFLTEIFRLGAILLVAIGGGTISLILGEHTILRNLFAATGLVAIVGLVIVLYDLQLHIGHLISPIKED
jgi:hypothetical protein